MKTRILTTILAICFAVGVLAKPALAQKMIPEIHGFIEAVWAGKLQSSDTKHEAYNLLEQRFQLKFNHSFKKDFLAEYSTRLSFKGEFLVDEYFSGKTDFDIREAAISLSPLSWIDVKFGRQILTWGTGDYLFINDVFPKDYISFFTGRNDEYLKKPSEAIKFSFFNEVANINLVLIPSFTPNTIPAGDRLSFFDTFQRGIAGRTSDRHLQEPYKDLQDAEIALRAYRTIESYEAALYFYKGYYRMPRGYLSEARRVLFYPRLNVYGASLRGPVFSGIGNMEAGYYDSRQDRQGDNRLIENSSFKIMAGYEKDLGNDWRAGVQYFYEQTLRYDQYRDALLSQDFFWDEHRHLLTWRLTKLLLNQTLKLGFFAFFSPSDSDAYLRPSIEYDVNDRLKISLGANFPIGPNDQTEFASMRQNSNVYLRARYSF